MELGNVFYEFALVLLVASLLGSAFILLRQPLLVAFIAAGVFVGPSGLGLIESDEEMELLATMGISVLLFVVGLKLDMQVIRSMGAVALSTGLGQVLFTSVVGYFLCRFMGIPALTSLYVAIALTFSSTIIIVKILSDKREIDSLHGRIAVGFLIVQDLVVVLLLIGLSAFGAAGEDVDPLREVGPVLVRGLVLVVGMIVLSRYGLPQLVRQVARSQELLVLFSVAWAIAISSLGDALGFSKEVGAFLAGMSLASTPYRDAIAGRLVGLRDFLLLFFFIHLGATLNLQLIGQQVGRSLLLSIFVLVGNPLIVMIIMGLMGYRKRTSFLAGLTVAQISEFSLIFTALGVRLGHVTEADLGLVTLVGLITIAMSSYMIYYSHRLYEWLAPMLGVFERRVATRELLDETTLPAHVDAIIFGLGRYGSSLAADLRERGHAILGVDFDPQVVHAWHERGQPAQYGDAEDPEFASSLPLGHTRWVLSTMPEADTNHILLNAVREQGYQGKVALTAHSEAAAKKFLRAGADLVLLPFVDAAERAAELLDEDLKARRSIAPAS